MKQPRSPLMNSITTKIVTGCGNLYLVTGGQNGGITELIAYLGKSGSCQRCQLEAITRAITIGLRHGVPLEEYTKALGGINCPKPVSFPKTKRVLSCPDGISKALKSVIDGHSHRLQ